MKGVFIMLKIKLNAYQIAEIAEDNLELRFFEWDEYSWGGDILFTLKEDAKKASIEEVRKESEDLLFFVYSLADFNVKHYIFNSDATLFIGENTIEIETFPDCYDDFIMEKF